MPDLGGWLSAILKFAGRSRRETRKKAQQAVRAWEAAGEQIGEKTEPITIKQATDEFLADAQARKLNERTIYKYKFLFDRLTTFADLQGVRFLKQLDTATLRKFVQP